MEMHSRLSFPLTDMSSGKVIAEKQLNTRDIVLVALLSAILVGCKEVLAFLPNVEIVTLMIILYTLHFQHLTLYIIYIFAGIQCCLYGINVYAVSYFYVWTLLYIAVRLLKPVGSFALWTILAVIFGLLFGTLCSPIYLLIGGWKMALSWIAAGLSFDLIHGFGNLVAMLVLFIPLDRLFCKLKEKKY